MYAVAVNPNFFNIGRALDRLFLYPSSKEIPITFKDRTKGYSKIPRIEIIRSGGETLTDVRPLIRFNVSVMLERNGKKEIELLEKNKLLGKENLLNMQMVTLKKCLYHQMKMH